MGKTPSLTPIYGKNDANERIQLGFKEVGNPTLIPIGPDGKPKRPIKVNTYKSTPKPTKTKAKKSNNKSKSRR